MSLARQYWSFWMELEVSPAKLRLFRFTFFAVFALDAWLQIAHAPRYGAFDFNVGHFAWLDAVLPMPSRSMMVVVFCVQAYLGVRLALGGMSRAAYLALALLFAFGYYISQLNSLQHHYLLSIALGLIAFFPWPSNRDRLHESPTGRKAESKQSEPTKSEGPTWPIRLLLLVTLSILYLFALAIKLDPQWQTLLISTLSLLAMIAFFPWPNRGSKPEPKEVQTWPIRMLLVSLSIMYLFAVVAKLDPLWLDGSTLKLEISEEWMRDLCDSLGWKTVAHLTVLVELALVFLLHIRRLWPLAMALGIGMHMSFELSGLDIGLFSYFMVSLYLLLLPESWVVWLASKTSPIFTALEAAFQRANDKLIVSLCLAAAALAMGAGLLQLLPFASAGTIALLTTLLAAADFAFHRRGANLAVGHLVAMLALLLFLHQTNAVRDYYRFWGGQERRRGNLSAAIIAYEDLVRFEPDYAGGRRRLGNIYKQVKRVDEALEQYEAGLALEPDDFKLNKSAAGLYHLRGRGKEALRCAERALATEGKNNDPALLRIRSHWQNQASP